MGGDTLPKEKKEGAASGGDGKPFSEVMDDVVGKAIPQKWHATSFAGTAVLALIFLILAIVTGGKATNEETKKIIKDDKKVNKLRFQIEEKCILLIATQQPWPWISAYLRPS